MEKKLAGLLGAMGALTAIAPSQAAAPSYDEAMRAESYADLLRPIPNAAALLQEANAVAAAEPRPEVMTVQYYHHHHHHHHHHHRFYRPRYYRPILRVPGYYRPRYHHHHHHHHHHHGFGVIIR